MLSDTVLLRCTGCSTNFLASKNTDAEGQESEPKSVPCPICRNPVNYGDATEPRAASKQDATAAESSALEDGGAIVA